MPCSLDRECILPELVLETSSVFMKDVGSPIGRIHCDLGFSVPFVWCPFSAAVPFNCLLAVVVYITLPSTFNPSLQ
jgi:hypothetical protein